MSARSSRTHKRLGRLLHSSGYAGRIFATVETACLGKGESPGHAPGLSFAFCQEAGSIVPSLEKELVAFDAEGGTIRFQPDHVIPDAVVRQIVRLRREQIESKLKR